jgi:hypothetical protein
MALWAELLPSDFYYSCELFSNLLPFECQKFNNGGCYSTIIFIMVNPCSILFKFVKFKEKCQIAYLFEKDLHRIVSGHIWMLNSILYKIGSLDNICIPYDVEHTEIIRLVRTNIHSTDQSDHCPIKSEIIYPQSPIRIHVRQLVHMHENVRLFP